MADIVKTPYEMLVRWNDAGQLQGASIRWRIATVDNAIEVSSIIGNPEPVAVAGAKGFPLDDILGQVHTDALATLDDKNTVLAEKDASVQEKTETIAELAKTIEGNNTTIATLEGQLESLTAELQVFKDVADLDKQETLRQEQIQKATEFLTKQGMSVAAAEIAEPAQAEVVLQR